MGPLMGAWLGVHVAQSVIAPTSNRHPESLEELVRDLRGADASRRRFAIREMNRVARVARRHEFGSLDSDATMDALQQLKFLDDQAVGVCVAHLQQDVEVRGCGRLLGHLETVTAYRVVSEARSRTTSRGEQRVLDRTLSILEDARSGAAP